MGAVLKSPYRVSLGTVPEASTALPAMATAPPLLTTLLASMLKLLAWFQGSVPLTFTTWLRRMVQGQVPPLDCNWYWMLSTWPSPSTSPSNQREVGVTCTRPTAVRLSLLVSRFTRYIFLLG